MLAHLNEPLTSVHIHYLIFSTRARMYFVLKNVFVFVFKFCVIKNAGVINIQISKNYAHTHLTSNAYNFLSQCFLVHPSQGLVTRGIDTARCHGSEADNSLLKF